MRRSAVVPALVLVVVACESTPTAARVSASDVGAQLAAEAAADDQPRDLRCESAVEAGRFRNAVVPPGAFCLLGNVTLTGNLTVMENARFIGFNNTIAGDVLGEKAGQVDFRFGRVGGNIRISGGIGTSPVGLDYVLSQLTLSAGSIHIKQVTSSNVHVNRNVLAKGSITIEHNEALGVLNVRTNDLGSGGHVHVFHNETRFAFVLDNTVRGNIHCRGNVAQSQFTAAGNTSLEGRLIGQCAAPEPERAAGS